jgi:hypothetical protein
MTALLSTFPELLRISATPSTLYPDPWRRMKRRVKKWKAETAGERIR